MVCLCVYVVIGYFANATTTTYYLCLCRGRSHHTYMITLNRKHQDDAFVHLD